MWPDLNDLVVPGREQKIAVRRESDYIAGAEPAAGRNRDFWLVAGAPVELLRIGWNGEKPENGGRNSETCEHGGTRPEGFGSPILPGYA